jgi:hypothetical protein
MELFPRFATQLLGAVPPGRLFQTRANDGPVWGIRGVDNANVEGAKVVLLADHQSGGPLYGKVSPTLKCIVLLSEYQLALAHDSIPTFSRSFSSGSIYLFGETIAIAAKPMNGFDEDEEWFEVATGRTYRPEGSAPVCRFDSWSIGIKMSGEQNTREVFVFKTA